MAQPCKICGHAERGLIEDALRDGLSLRVTAQRYGVTKDALARHARAHLTIMPTATPLSSPPHYEDVLSYWKKCDRFLAWRGSLLRHCPRVTMAELEAVLAHAVRLGDLADGGAFHTATAALKQRLQPPAGCVAVGPA